ncbi:hypothetical protein AeRB84_017502 [Aphanomyces euteiches]|nr:hypothetical protein AeRB84_017502 [Aphanomyces euteiches]
MLLWEMCQHTRFIGATTSEMCLWIEPLGLSRYAFWASNLTYESIESICIKFAFRCWICIYICYLLWAHYYHHYVVLLYNLRHLGLSNEYKYYKIVLGDPAYVILSDPLVALAMAADNWYSANYVAMAVAQVSQLQDAWLYIRGCLYLSRFVWFAYLGMQAGSFMIKRRQREDSFAPVDPALLAVSTYIYCGLIMSLICNTPMVWLMYGSWYVFLPPLMYQEAIETISLVIFVTLLMAILPLGFSRILVLWQHRQANRVRPTSSRMLKQSTSDYTYNDLKALILLSLSMRKHNVRMLGGTLH